MTTSTLSAAQAVLAPSQPLLVAAAPTAAPAQAAVQWQGRSIHWITALLALGALTSVIIIVASSIFLHVPVIVMGVFFFAVTAIGAYHSYDLSVYEAYEPIVQELTAKVKDLKNLIARIQRSDDDEKKTLAELEQLRRHEAEMEKVYQSNLEKKQKDLDASVAKLAKTETAFQAQLTQAETQLADKGKQLSDAEAKLKLTVESFTADMQALTEKISAIQADNGQLQTMLTAAKSTLDQFERDNSQLKAEDSHTEPRDWNVEEPGPPTLPNPIH